MKSNPLFSKILGRTEIAVVLIVELWICAFFFFRLSWMVEACVTIELKLYSGSVHFNCRSGNWKFIREDFENHDTWHLRNQDIEHDSQNFFNEKTVMLLKYLFVIDVLLFLWMNGLSFESYDSCIQNSWNDHVHIYVACHHFLLLVMYVDWGLTNPHFWHDILLG